MRQVLHKETTAATKPERGQERRDDRPALENEAVLATLETNPWTGLDCDAGGDPFKGIAVAVIAGSAVWIALAAAIVLFWL